MRDHLAYFVYVVKHKWHVLEGGLRLSGIPLWRLLVHDASKFSREEWLPYVRQFYNADGTKRTVRDATGAYDPSVQSEAFKEAWAHHWHNNDHHWNFYLARNPKQWAIQDRSFTPEEYDTPFPMPAVAIREMCVDWYAASMAQGNGVDIEGWYWQNKKNMILHTETEKGIGSVLLEMWAKGIIQSNLF